MDAELERQVRGMYDEFVGAGAAGTRDVLHPDVDEGYDIDELEELPGGILVMVTFRGRGRGRGSGAPAEQQFAHVFGFENGLVRRFFWYRSREEAVAAASS